ncbi:hypothetical protein A0H81_12154 [Grifola frondosa]|uniref:Uncharacterized protein n=1 Tax=Grifola frondosa TaxID=5627 RepID=A0A1C7LT21_GRIFR|nr:hypothetical protein A0H81_12154 [Grifola frondosa]
MASMIGDAFWRLHVAPRCLHVKHGYPSTIDGVVTPQERWDSHLLEDVEYEERILLPRYQR